MYLFAFGLLLTGSFLADVAQALTTEGSRWCSLPIEYSHRGRSRASHRPRPSLAPPTLLAMFGVRFLFWQYRMLQVHT